MKTSRFSHNQKTRRPRRKLLLAATSLVVLLAVGGGYLLYSHNQQPAADKASADSTDAQEQTIEPKASVIKNDDGTTPGATSNQIPANPDVSLQITELAQQNSAVIARAVITAGGSGNCVFSFTTPEGRPVVKQVASSNQACSVSIPEVEFDKLGEWELTVSFYYNNTKAEASRKIMIN